MLTNYYALSALLAVLYFLSGKLGLMLAVPPGYATIIWPASGIALGMLLVHGARLWPGVLVGSCLLNAWNSGVFADPDWLTLKSCAALLVAAGSTLQAVAGRALVARLLGWPLALTSVRQVVLLFALGGPLNCVIAATVGVGSLYALGILGRADLLANWFAWWSGDTLGVIVMLPVVLLAPGNRESITWRGSALGRIPLAGIVLLLLPLGITFFAWKTASENGYQRGVAKFEALTTESEKALQNRIASYGNALLGAAGFMQGSAAVSRDEWRTYVQTIQVRENFPGIGGLGWVQAVPDAEMAGFLAGVRADGAPDFRIHPRTTGVPNYIVTYVEPDEENRVALGLNIGFEHNRLAAVTSARDSGEVVISGRVVLVQDEQRSPGFLLLYPVYHRGMALGTVDGRRAALRGLTYAPFVAKNALDDLTHSQSTQFRMRIYDGTREDAATLIYANDTAVDARPGFTVRTTIDLMQRQWHVVWESSPAFETAEHSGNPALILVGGLVFTALLTLVLVVLSVRRVEHIEQMVGARRFAMPLLVFLVIGAGSCALYSRLRAQELAFVSRQAQDQAGKAGALLRWQAGERIAALARMAARWEAVAGTPQTLWRRDASNYVAQLPGLRALEWIGDDYHVRWVEPVAGNESAVGLDVRFDPQRTAALRGAAERRHATLTPPLALVQGYDAFIVYLPLRRDGRFDGFLAGVFSIHDFFQAALSAGVSRNYTMSVLYGGTEYFSSAGPAPGRPAEGMTETTMRIQDQNWTLRITPTQGFVDSQHTALPLLVLVAGLLVAALSALSVRTILISRLKSAHLAKSLALNAGIISSSAHLVIAIDDTFRVMIFNRAAEQALGYPAADIVGRRAIPIFMDPAELAERARTLSAELGEPIPVGPGIFTRIPLRDGFEKREWTFVRKDGSRFPVNVIITPLRDAATVTGFLGVIEDISARHEMDRMKSEFTAVVSHELRTPLTSIRGSLGLILGAMARTLPDKVRSLLEIAQSNCERLVLLVNDILDIEKFSAGQMRFDMQTLPLAGVALQAVQANEGYARKFGARIELGPVDPAILVTIDPDRFIQVMSNLLSNAAKYSPAGGTVRVTCERGQGERSGFVRIGVRDAGPGIPENFRARIFEKFSQADSSTTREKGGTGLGLHIARRFVEHMQGRIGFESQAGDGTLFWVDLPVNDVAAGTGS